MGGEKRGKVTDFKEIRGYILVRKPNMLRMIGLYPIVRNKAFDMVSDRQEFKLMVSATNKFYIGHNQVIEGSDNPLDTCVRRQFTTRYFCRPSIPKTKLQFMESSTEMVVDAQTHKLVKQPNYVLDVSARPTKAGRWRAKCFSIAPTWCRTGRWFTTSMETRVTDASYQVYKDFEGVQYPTYIDIKRPQEEYDIRLIMVKLTINQSINDDQFALQQPPGSILVNLDERNKSASTGADSHHQRRPRRRPILSHQR